MLKFMLTYANDYKSDREILREVLCIFLSSYS